MKTVHGFIILLHLFTARSEFCTDEEKKWFSCNQKNLTYFKMGPAEISCNDGLCNYIYQKKGGNCVPCLDRKVLCGNLFRCTKDEKMIFTIFTWPEKYSCGSGYKCNEGKETNCDACVKESCSGEPWTCSTANKREFVFNDLIGTCPDGRVCRNEYSPPCHDPCGPETMTTSRTTTSIVTQPTSSSVTTETTIISQITTIEDTNPISSSEAAPTVTSTTITTTDQSPIETESSPITTTTESDPTNSETTLTPTNPPTTRSSTETTSAITTTLPPFEMPNCNDGEGGTRPCRPGPFNEDYYYKCKYYSSTWYELEKRMCKNLSLDPECMGEVCHQNTSSSITATISTSTSSSGTVSIIPITTTKKTLPPFQMPNCNDGQGGSNPCRPGPPGKNFYYKCTYYSPVWYDYEPRLCQNLASDPICKDKVCHNVK